MYSYEKYVRMCNNIQRKPTPVAIEAGLQRSQISRWKNGGGISDASAYKLADYFGVDPSVLTEDGKKPTAQGDGLTENHRLLIEFAKTLTEDQAVLALKWLKAVVGAD